MRTHVSLGVLLCGLLCADSAVAARANTVLISGVLFDGLGRGNPEPESAIRLTNTSQKRPAKVSDFGLTDRYTPRRFPKQDRRGGVDVDEEWADQELFGFEGSVDNTIPGGRANPPREVKLPSGAVIPPGGDIWLANEGAAFLEVFGYLPDYEAVNTLPEVPDLEASQGWIMMPAEHGTVALQNGFGEVVDFVAYDVHPVPKISAGMLPDQHWKGPPVRLQKSSFYGWTNQILKRDRDEKGRLLKDTNSGRDWDNGFSKKRLGEEPAHRIELPGQSHFVVDPLRNVSARVLATSAPDNNHEELVKAFAKAKKTIRVSVYQLTNDRIADALIKARLRGVQVMLWLEGSPVGGIPDKERYLTDKMAKAGIPVHFLVSNVKKKIRPRYRFDHSKYVIIDDRLAIIGTENYGSTGVPTVNSYGNRGWMVHVEQPAFVRQLRAVWDHDYRPGAMRDVVGINDKDNDPYGLPYRDPHFKPEFKLKRGLYDSPVAPAYVADRMDLELVLSPDTSLNEKTGLIGLMNRAKRTLYVEQNSIRRRWGRREDTQEQAPDLPLEAIVAAARRGVKVRVLLDGTWYNIQGDEDRDNDNTVAYLNSLARDEGLDVAAKIINLETTHLEKIHAKGIIVDGQEVFVGSINWTENSFKGNREVGVIVGHKKVAGYYEKLFVRDWTDSRMYEVTVRDPVTARSAPRKTGKGVGSYKPGDRLVVVGEYGRQKGDGPSYLEVRVRRGKTAFVPIETVSEPLARSNEAIHLLGRNAVVEGRVVEAKLSKKILQLRFDDEERAPFVAVIFKNSLPRFQAAGINPVESLKGRRVRVRGRLDVYRIPEVVLTRPDQIEVLE